MAAHVYVLTEDEWRVLSRITDALNAGGIVVPPDVARRISAGLSVEVDVVDVDFDLIDYDGVTPDVWIDIAADGNMAELAVRDAVLLKLGIND